MIICGTGHRPQKLFTSDPFSYLNLVKLTKFLEKELEQIKPTIVISGLALGFDTALAKAALSQNILLISAIPFEGQENKWGQEAKDTYEEILERSQQVVYVDKAERYNPKRVEGYAAWKLHKRNEYMVDFSHAVLALFDGSNDGGTASCLRYAKNKNKEIINLWDKWLEVRS